MALRAWVLAVLLAGVLLLPTSALTPPPLDTTPDSGLSWPQVVARHQQILATNPALRAAYFAVADPLARYGLPLTPPTPEANGAAIVVRTSSTTAAGEAGALYCSATRASKLHNTWTASPTAFRRLGSSRRRKSSSLTMRS